MRIQFNKLEQDIKTLSSKASLILDEATEFTRLLIFRSWLKLQSARRRYTEAAEIFRERKTPETTATLGTTIRNLEKAKKRQHLTRFVKGQVAYDLGLINGDELFIVNELKSSGLGAGRVPVREKDLFATVIKPLLETYALETVPA